MERMNQVSYRVLLAEQLSVADKLAITAKVSTMFSGPEAAKHSCQLEDNRLINHNWQFEVLDRLGRVVVIKYRGAEIACFIKRQITSVELLPGDPVPEGVIKDPDDAWVRMDLLGLSARQVSSRVGKEKKSAEEELQLALRELALKQQLFDQMETEYLKMSQKVEQQAATITQLRNENKFSLSAGAKTAGVTVKIKTRKRSARR